MSRHNRQALLSAMQENELFASFNPSFQNALIDIGQVFILNAGVELFAAGSNDRHLYGVVAGELVASNVDDLGNVAVLLLLRPGTWFGEIAFFDGQPRTHTVHALTRSRVLRVRSNDLEMWLKDHPEDWRHLGCMMSSKLRVALESLQDDAILPLESRIVRRLQLITTNYKTRSRAPSEVPISQELLAQMLGVSKQSVSKGLMRLEHQGLIRRQYGKIKLIQPLSSHKAHSHTGHQQ